MAKYLVKIAEEKDLPILLNGVAYKPDVPYTDGSYSLLVQHYIKELGGWIVEENPSVYVLVHPTDEPIEDVVNFDPWRSHKNKNVISYGFGKKVLDI